ncbi:DNA methyltransferase [Falsihalocynthiibacter arcticus]|uniref:site-specific DNA-methyltransferase (adenine-specific) n=1 Tax=Falsihalocynthiibacter arcticus TaxID=1579316 RepID=A0A126UZS6_9RHOB|nr:DNA methyltransferase [Falsihalocynthiibacter arcticus]AML51540.1 DNA methylase [Falsihalocynthiibacter arcticus]
MQNLFQLNESVQPGPVEVLGRQFSSDQERRKYFLAELQVWLNDAEFRSSPGFPNARDEDILEMSDPPFYTACPNPWLRDFIEHGAHDQESGNDYLRQPMAVDVSVGKSDPLYQAHTYHTKVPHLAIVPSILHYTNPNDIILDAFSGSGMTGIAAQWCGCPSSEFKQSLEADWKKQGLKAPEWGSRRVLLSDLSPAATFISSNNNIPFDVHDFLDRSKEIFEKLSLDIGWMYETLHSDGQSIGQIEFTIWSELFSCEACSGEIVFTEAAMDEGKSRADKKLECPHCGALAKKETLDLAFEAFVDPASGQLNTKPKRVPTLISYKVGKQVYTKKPDSDDFEKIRKIAEMPLPPEMPLASLPDCQMIRVGRMKTTNTTAIHHMFLPRAAQTLTYLWREAEACRDKRTRLALRYYVEQAIWTMSVLNRYQPQGFKQVNKYLPGVFYVPSQICENSPTYSIGARSDRIARVFSKFTPRSGNAIVSTGDASNLAIPDESIDYIFTDPPFGENIYYADLNFLIESWHRVTTNAGPEAIIDRVRNKGVVEYQHLMHSCFSEYHRVLKSGRWITIVFSNSKAAVWNAIQVALQQVGFVVAEVTALDKKLGSFQQVTSPNVVKQDLVISAYKPDGELEKRLVQRGAAPESAWDFVQTHLRQLSVIKSKNGLLEFVLERDPRRVYDRMVAWFVRHDVPVPLSTEEFLDGLRNRFPQRDGMVFLSDQIPEYDKKRAQAAQAPQMELFVSDERSAIDWLTDFLRKRPSSYQEVHPEFTTQVGAGWKKHEAKPELSHLLDDNFLRFDSNGEVPSQIHSYLSTNFKDLRGLEKEDPRLKAKAKDRWFVPDPNKAKDLEQKRERSLLKEFETYKSATKRQLKESRLEVLRTGFRTAWAVKDYKTIIGIAEKLPDQTLQEDEKLLLWYDQALTRMEAND